MKTRGRMSVCGCYNNPGEDTCGQVARVAAGLDEGDTCGQVARVAAGLDEGEDF